ncbi:TPA: hypothetical protein N0F65_006557 [Lagenidium giganteum]|uniref:Uncharacterized protein n=1 Tax=Lagenidium giganteum TaxID=4803 RepID=A0AAV2YPK7_9STRA|nr:TPA: hypothetical protein N0F65_006557 [Lagenidium giganteum]
MAGVGHNPEASPVDFKGASNVDEHQNDDPSPRNDDPSPFPSHAFTEHIIGIEGRDHVYNVEVRKPVAPDLSDVLDDDSSYDEESHIDHIDDDDNRVEFEADISVDEDGYECFDSDGSGWSDEELDVSEALKVSDTSDDNEGKDDEANDESPVDVMSRTTTDRSRLQAASQIGWEASLENFSPQRQNTSRRHGLTERAQRTITSPAEALWFFLPSKMWRRVAAEPNRYASQSLQARARAIIELQRKKNQRDPDVIVESLKSVRERLMQAPPVTPCIADSTYALCTQDLAVSSLECQACRSHTFWNVWCVYASTTIRRTFKEGMYNPSKLSFDEGVLPSRSKYNKTHIYMQDKPHKWGTKLGCAKPFYYSRFEIYCGKKQHATTYPHMAKQVLTQSFAKTPSSQSKKWTGICFGSDASTVLVRFKLGNGFPVQLVDKRKSRPKAILQESFDIAVLKENPAITAMKRWDNKPVYLLSSCWRMPNGKKEPVKCPNLFHDYLGWMGGVDIHAELAIRFRFPSESGLIFLGLMDFALVMPHRVQRCARRKRSAEIENRDFLEEEAYKALLATTDEVFRPVESPSSQTRPSQNCQFSDHVSTQTTAFWPFMMARSLPGGEKNREATQPNGSNGSMFVLTPFSIHRIHLCAQPRHINGGVSCFQLWHERWHAGQKIPAHI